MSYSLHRITHWVWSLFHAELPGEETNIPNLLMTRAEACAGRSPHQAEELRLAACTYLSVVR